MRNIYAEHTANRPRLGTDSFFADYDNRYRYVGAIDDAMKFAEKKQLFRKDLWARFVRQYKEAPDSADGGWRGEYWGKMMRGACFVYAYERDEKLYEVLAETVRDMMSSADENGRISTYSKDHEFFGWDMWSRKYVLLGMQYFLEVCDDEDLKAEIVASMMRQADYIISKVGKEAGKTPITSTSGAWRGLNSSSILEPIVRLYSITGEKRYFDFAEYIVNTGCTQMVNIFRLAYENGLHPYQYPVTKAYEMTSCFEGLLEFYRITGTEWYKTAIINFADRVLEDDFTVIGCSGCTHELFDNSTVRQANTTNYDTMQETCVTVTLMKFMYQMNLLTGDPKYADAFEISLYNAYLGSMNTEDQLEREFDTDADWIAPYRANVIPEPLAYDSYSPLTAGGRGLRPGGFKVMSDGHYYSCCSCIASLGIGLVPKMQLLSTDGGFTMNLYVDGEASSRAPGGELVTFVTETDYPKFGNVRITVRTAAPARFELALRIPVWSKKTSLAVGGEKVGAKNGYTTFAREWNDGDVIELELDMRTEVLRRIPYGERVLMNTVDWAHDMALPTYDREDPKAKDHIALRRGPVMLAQDSRLGYSLDDASDIDVDADGYVDIKLGNEKDAPYKAMVSAKVPLKNGGDMALTDYSSTGKLWSDEAKAAVWIRTK